MKKQSPSIALACSMLLTSMACTSYGMQQQRIEPALLPEYSEPVDPWFLDQALHIAVINRHYSKALRLLEAGAEIGPRGGDTPLHHAIIDLKMTELLLEHGAQVDPHDLIGCTPLHYAVREGGSAVVKLLLQHKAFANTRDHDGKTPLFYAFCSAVIELLQLNGAAINAHDNDGETPVHVAAVRGSYYCDFEEYDKLDLLHDAQFAAALKPDSQQQGKRT